MSVEMEEFFNYDMSAWQDRGMIIASAVKPIATKKVEKRKGLRTIVALSFLAFGITHVEPQIPLTQAVMTWARTAPAQSNRLDSAEYVPAGYWGRLITQIHGWPQVTDVALPDFDSLAG